ncbi:Chemotaxis regulator - transmits chemoreceptor signals to flagelllar motor components CheY [Fulvivirga imtechensis AK7]|uniref:Chemotaxis regulator-transmits chemoreceptor signals to flagelllar motor components CheY n=1 Tax=Fulvivirga imtechensis AK7 TaxID=1237149 RepID=L8JLM3_9BACT|nr:response regulator [Fulvivirga imtechensis]ELR69710.1 Chemotaxis regulator - transmits chemoreceptor signals to flagelllar motor components CheY [Fulvivirga imtechensis AK7]
MSKNILVVDDSYYMRTILKNILEDAGYNVVNEAASGQDALKGVDEQHDNLDLVTLDLILPDNSGLDVLRSIKEKYPDQNVVVVSAVGQSSIVEQAMEIGASAYIVKPFDEEKVVEVVGEILGNEINNE